VTFIPHDLESFDISCDVAMKIDFVDREVNVETGALLAQATFPNSKKLIKPGQYARIRAIVELIEDGMLIPQRTVTELQGNYYVMVIGDSGIVKQKFVELGSKYKDYWLVRDGLDKDSKILFEGLQKVREGMKIQPVDTVFQSKFKE
jgi:membrane fusion protein (multidrug efflux system)